MWKVASRCNFFARYTLKIGDEFCRHLTQRKSDDEQPHLAHLLHCVENTFAPEA
jgi:hypothetical protein